MFSPVWGTTRDDIYNYMSKRLLFGVLAIIAVAAVLWLASPVGRTTLAGPVGRTTLTQELAGPVGRTTFP